MLAAAGTLGGGDFFPKASAFIMSSLDQVVIGGMTVFAGGNLVSSLVGLSLDMRLRPRLSLRIFLPEFGVP